MTLSPPVVSIVITCFNYADYVHLAIESALAQTYPRVETVVVDDGSTDGSDKVIARYQSRLTSLRQNNQGHLAAVDRGYRQSTGDLVIFLDADDFLEPSAVEAVVAIWEPACAKVQYDLSLIDREGQRFGRLCNFSPGYNSGQVRAAFQRWGTYRWPVTSGNAYARWFLEEILPLNVDRAPDGYLNTVAPLFGEVVTIPRILGAFRLHGRNLWSSTGTDLDQLPVRIDQRYREIAFLRDQAARRGVSLPRGNVLDHELTFITYRLMATKLRMAYRDGELDTVSGLWRSGLKHLWQEWLPRRMKLAHGVWLTALVLSPRWLIRPLARWRFRFPVLVRRRAC